MEIMVVDDEPILRLVFSEILRDAGYSVSDAPTADEALAMLEDGCEPRVVVTDVHMPGELNGFELAKVICRRWPHIGAGDSVQGHLARPVRPSRLSGSRA